MDENEVFTPLITLTIRSRIGWWRKKSGSEESFKKAMNAETKERQRTPEMRGRG